MKLNWITAHRRLLKLVWPFVLTVALQVALGVFSLNILSAVRAYVGGESLWSKGQKDAIYALYRYADSGHPADLVQYQQALGVIAGDRRAREALEQTEPNTDVAREGFLAGGNAPSDVDNLIWLFVEFRDDEDISHVARLWREGDRLMDELNLIAIRLQEAAASRTLAATDVDTIVKCNSASAVVLTIGPWVWLRLRGGQIMTTGSGAWGVRLAGLALAVSSGWALWMGLVEYQAPWCLVPQ